MTKIYSEANFNLVDVIKFLNSNEYDTSDLSQRYRNYDRIGYTELMGWLNKNFTKWNATMIMRKMECECVGYIDELHLC